MIYLVKKLPKMCHQMSLDEFLFGTSDTTNYIKNYDETSTRTFEYERLSWDVRYKTDVIGLVDKLVKFNTNHKDLHAVADKHTLYRQFKIPKSSGGLRTINAPNAELKNALRELKTIFEEDFGALYHTNAFAYIRRRSILDAMKRHQTNESNWYGKYDLHDFFGSTTLEFAKKMFSMIYPFNLVMSYANGEEALMKAVSLGFLDGGLPQGTPLSPMLTNIFMIPIDYKLTQKMRDFEKQKFVYTRYADDFTISSVYNFDFRKVENLIVETLQEFEAPFTINAKKTRYGSRNGQNWNLGLMINKDNMITVGYKRKRQFQTMLFNYAKDKQNGIAWDLGDVQHLDGLRAYYRMVEKETIDRIVQHISNKVGVDILREIKADLGRKTA